MIKLVPIDAVQASEYNPRRNDEKRLALTELSLRKLGFLLPIPLLAAYHGAQGRRNPALKWGFYAFYPLHLLILSLLQRF